MKYFLIFIVSVINVQLVSAQLPETTMETILESAPENADPEEVIQQLSYLRQHPLNLNTAVLEELCTPGLFDPVQAAAILNHRKRYGCLISFEELQAIATISQTTLQRVKPFFVVEPIINKQEWQPGNIFSNGKHIVLLRSRRVFGREISPDFNGDYYGQNIAWRYTSGTLFDIGFNGDKDPGEAYFRQKKLPLMDSWNYHFFARPGGKFKALALGDYQVNCGQGLVVWTGFAGSKGPDVLNVSKLGPVLRPYTAFGEYGNYRGAAFSIGGQKILFTGWLSDKAHDSDLEGNYFRTIKSDGYHRTENEIADEKNVKRFISGFNVRIMTGTFRHEFTVQHSRYNAMLQKGEKAYQYFEPVGNNFLNASYAYAGQLKNISFSGEVATNEKGNISCLNSLLLVADTKLALVFLHRYLPPGYYSFSADPFRENSKSVNEQGFYSGLQWQFRPKIKLSAYFDYFLFPWMRYQADGASEGHEWLLQSTWVPSRNSELYLRFRRQIKDENLSGEYSGLTKLQEVRRDNLRADARLKLTADVFFQARAEWTRVQYDGKASYDGWLLFQEMDLRPMGKAWSVTLRYSVFSTGNYDTRIYAYEQELPGSFSLPAYYGSGSSAYVLMRYKVKKGLDFWFRVGTERDFSNESVRIRSPGVQLRWIFG